MTLWASLPYSYQMPGESNRAGGSFGAAFSSGGIGRTELGFQGAGRWANPTPSEGTVALEMLRRSHEGHLATAREAAQYQAEIHNLSAQLGAAHELVMRQDAAFLHSQGSHAAEVESSRWEGFMSGVVDMLRNNPGVYLHMPFLLDAHIPPTLLAALQPHIALLPDPGPVVNLSVNGVAFSAGVHPPGVGSAGSVAGGMGDHFPPAMPFGPGDYYVPELPHLAVAGPGDAVADASEDEGASTDEEDEEAVDDGDHHSS